MTIRWHLCLTCWPFRTICRLSTDPSEQPTGHSGQFAASSWLYADTVELPAGPSKLSAKFVRPSADPSGPPTGPSGLSSDLSGLSLNFHGHLLTLPGRLLAFPDFLLNVYDHPQTLSDHLLRYVFIFLWHYSRVAASLPAIFNLGVTKINSVD